MIDGLRWIGVLSAAALYAAACPPHQLWLGAWLVPGIFLTAVAGGSVRGALARGTAFALVFGYGMTSWAVGASLEYFDFSPWVSWLFAAGVWLACGFPYALLAVAYCALHDRVPSRARPVLAAWLWVGAELIRAELLSGMPWELLGHTQFANLPIIQVADLGGVYAVSFAMVLVSVGVAEMVRESLRSGSLQWRVAVLPACVIASVAAYGMMRLAEERDELERTEMQVAVVQGNVPNSMRWKQSHFEHALEVYEGLSDRAAAFDPDLIVWPENAVSFYVDREPALRERLGRVAGRADAGLIFGAPRHDDAAGVVRNSAYWMGPSGNIDGIYDKQKLVPFAEYDPLESTPPTGELVYRGSTSPMLLAADVGAVICYEIIFPSLVRDLVKRGARLLVNLSNDSWMDVGDGVAPRQHSSMAIFRAVETRRYLVRASASGHSGFVSPRGRSYSSLPNQVADAAVASVGFRDGLTPYVRWGDRWILIGMIGCAATVARNRKVPA